MTSDFKGKSPLWNIPTYYSEYVVLDAGWRHMTTLVTNGTPRTTNDMDGAYPGGDYTMDANSCPGESLTEYLTGIKHEAYHTIYYDNFCQAVADLTVGDPDLHFGLSSPDGDWTHTSSSIQQYNNMAFYLHDLIAVVAQKRLHDGGLAEGEGDIAFPLDNIDVGLTASQMQTAVKNTIASPQGKNDLLQVADGVFTNETGVPDVFIDRKCGLDGNYQYFLSFHDGNGLPYANPGFYQDENLAAPAGEDCELYSDSSGSCVQNAPGAGYLPNRCVKLSVTGGETYYVQTENGWVFRLKMQPLLKPTEARFEWVRVQ